MSNILPTLAAKFANEVYQIENIVGLKTFLLRKEFSQDKSMKSSLTATTGSRLINKRDAFAVCARGGEQYKNDVFLIFRGTATKADMVTDARTGLNISTTKSLVQPNV